MGIASVSAAGGIYAAYKVGDLPGVRTDHSIESWIDYLSISSPMEISLVWVGVAILSGVVLYNLVCKYNLKEELLTEKLEKYIVLDELRKTQEKLNLELNKPIKEELIQKQTEELIKQAIELKNL